MKGTNNLLMAGMGGRLDSFVVYQVGGQTIVRSRPYPRKNDSDEQQRSQIEMMRAAQEWKLLTPQQRQGWNALQARMPQWNGTDKAATTSGYHLYVAVARSRRVLGLPPVLDAPFAPTFPPFLGDMTAHLTRTETAFKLSVTGPRFPAPCQVMATPSQSAGRDALATKHWAQICVLGGIGEQGVDLTEVFRNKFYMVHPNQQVGVRLCPISEEGFRSPPLSLVAGPL